MNTEFISAALFAVLTLASCSNSLPVEGTWKSEMKEEQTGMTMTGTRTFTFTPDGRKGGMFTETSEGKAVLDGLGELTFVISIPGTYTVEKDRVVLVNDTTAVKSNVAFHPTSFIGLLGAGSMGGLEDDFKKEVATPSPTDTLFAVSVKENKMTLTNKKEVVEFSRID